MGNKSEEKKQQKREALLNTAFYLFSTKGLPKTSVSDITARAGVAKGTFYLYFEDKLDIRNKLISHKASQLFTAAYDALTQTDITDIEEKILFLVDDILNRLDEDHPLLTFISKYLSWGVFKSALDGPESGTSESVRGRFFRMLEESGRAFKEPELMIYLIIELVSSTSYSSILYNQPVPLAELKPHLYELVRHIIRQHYV